MSYTLKYYTHKKDGSNVYIDGHIKSYVPLFPEKVTDKNNPAYIYSTYTNPLNYDTRRLYVTLSTVNCGYFSDISISYYIGNLNAVMGAGSNLDIYADDEGIGDDLTNADWDNCTTAAQTNIPNGTWNPGMTQWVTLDISNVGGSEYTYVSKKGNTDFRLKCTTETDAANSVQVKIQTADRSGFSPYLTLTYTLTMFSGSVAVMGRHGKHCQEGYSGYWHKFLE